MIEAFNKIAATGGTARPDELAGGIGKALVTTLMGLIVAIPTMIAFSFFRNKIDSLVAEAGKRVEQIMMPLGRRRQQSVSRPERSDRSATQQTLADSRRQRHEPLQHRSSSQRHNQPCD